MRSTGAAARRDTRTGSRRRRARCPVTDSMSIRARVRAKRSTGPDTSRRVNHVHERAHVADPAPCKGQASVRSAHRQESISRRHRPARFSIPWEYAPPRSGWPKGSASCTYPKARRAAALAECPRHPAIPRGLPARVPFDPAYQSFFVTLSAPSFPWDRSHLCARGPRAGPRQTSLASTSCFAPARCRSMISAVTGQPARFNMPFEMGLACSIALAGGPHDVVVLDTVRLPPRQDPQRLQGT